MMVREISEFLLISFTQIVLIANLCSCFIIAVIIINFLQLPPLSYDSLIRVSV